LSRGALPAARPTVVRKSVLLSTAQLQRSLCVTVAVYT